MRRRALIASLLLVVSLGTVARDAATLGTLLHEDDFRSRTSDQWIIEAEGNAKVTRNAGVLDLTTDKGLTLWYRAELEGRIAIEFDATAVSAGGPNDRVSDLNCFFMARNPNGPEPVFARSRGGKFAEYNELATYYAGLGGNGNTTTRFRRYIGDRENRPLLPEHDLSRPDALLVANRKQHIRIIIDGEDIAYWRDGVRLLHHVDAAPYTRGWFAFRTTQSHLRIERFRVSELK